MHKPILLLLGGVVAGCICVAASAAERIDPATDTPVAAATRLPSPQRTRPPGNGT
jgi:hypothetical protein